jgi:hypothetical protein
MRRMPLVAPIVLLVGVVLGAPAAAAAAAPRGRWDPRVERYVRFVERARALDFVTPVRVRCLVDDGFRAAASRWYDDVGDRDRAIAEGQAADLLALGLVTAPVDLLAARTSTSRSRGPRPSAPDAAS